MKAESQKLLIFRCLELLGRFSFTDKLSQKRDLPQTESQKLLNAHEKDAILDFAKFLPY